MMFLKWMYSKKEEEGKIQTVQTCQDKDHLCSLTHVPSVYEWQSEVSYALIYWEKQFIKGIKRSLFWFRDN